MAVITLTKDEVKHILGKLEDSKIDNALNLAELGVEKITDNEIDLEITPNRPDLLSKSGVKRYLESYFKKSGLKEYSVETPEKDFKVTIDKSVKKVWPYAVCAIVKNLKFSDEKIKELIDIQEKLTLTIGRNRMKLGLGVYPLDKIKLPIKYLAKKPEDIKFQPLEFPREINGRQILSQHPTGREYAHLVSDFDVFPVFIDANDEIMSMPPIINSHKTGKVTEETKDLFIECTGNNLEFLKKALNIMVTALADMGGTVYAMEIQDGKEKYLSPNLESEKFPFSIDNVNKLIGLNLKEKDIIKYLEKMGNSYEKDKEESFALIPPYRTDILHEVDIAEDIAIAYGFENLNPEIPKISTIGEEDSVSVLKRKIAEILTGLGLLEISTYHLSTKEKQFKNIGVKDFKDDLIEVIDSKTENNVLRVSLLSQSIAILSENPDSAYPQKIFEIGKVFSNDKNSETQIAEKEKLCISLCHEKANFTEIKQTLDYLMRMLNIKYEIKESEHPSFIPGRCGEIIVNKNPIGFIGEICPFILHNNKIKMPVASLEMEIEKLNNTF